MAQRSSVGGNSADVTSTSTSGKSSTTSSGMNSVPGVLTRNRAQSPSQATRDADTMPNSKGGGQGPDGVHPMAVASHVVTSKCVRGTVKVGCRNWT